MITTTYPSVQFANSAVARWTTGGPDVVLVSPYPHLADPYGTSDHLGFSVDRPVVHSPITSWVTTMTPALPTIAEEVRALRDSIVDLAGLTRQEIARSIGVDRRSLSGYVTGEIRPTDERLHMLRELAEVAKWTADRFGERARELLRGTNSESSPLNLIATRHVDTRESIKTIAAALRPASPQFLAVGRRTNLPPLHAHALGVWGKDTNQPERARTVRDESVYEQDPSEAAHPPEPPPRPRRKHI